MSYDRTAEPTLLRQGERIGWTKTFADYGADEYSLEYRFAGPGDRFEVTATANGTSFDALLTVAAGQVIGKYVWQAWLTETATPTNKFVAASGFLKIETGFADGGTGVVETRSTAQQIVDAIDAAILASGASAVIEYEITGPTGSRKVKESKSEAMKQRTYYAGIVARENARQRARETGKFGRRVDLVIYDED